MLDFHKQLLSRAGQVQDMFCVDFNQKKLQKLKNLVRLGKPIPAESEFLEDDIVLRQVQIQDAPRIG